MADYPSNIPPILQSQSQKEATLNALVDALSPSSLYGRNAVACTGLVWGYLGGYVPISGVPTPIANGTLTLTASVTCYIRKLDSTGVVSFVTSAPTAWPALNGGYTPLYDVTTGAAAINNDWNDYRGSTLFGAATGAGGPPTGAAGGDLTGTYPNPTVTTDTITNAKLANVATATFKARTTAGTGDPEDLTVTQATALLNTVVGDSGAGGVKGLAPATGAGDSAAGKFLKADATWAVPSGSGAPTGAQYVTLATDATLTSERVLTAGSGITLTDNGAGSTVVVAATGAGSSADYPTYMGGGAFSVQPWFVERKPRFVQWINGTGTPQQHGLLFGSPTGGGATVGTTSMRDSLTGGLFSSTSTAGTGSNILANNPIYWQGNAANLGGFFAEFVFGMPAAQSGMRYMVGLGAGSFVVTSVDPSAKLDAIFFGVDAADSNLQVMHNDGSGTATKIDLGANFPGKTNDAVFRASLFVASNTTTVYYRVDRLDSAFTATGNFNTNIPSTTTFMDVSISASNGTSAAIISFLLSHVYIDTPY